MYKVTCYFRYRFNLYLVWALFLLHVAAGAMQVGTLASDLQSKPGAENPNSPKAMILRDPKLSLCLGKTVQRPCSFPWTVPSQALNGLLALFPHLLLRPRLARGGGFTWLQKGALLLC